MLKLLSINCKPTLNDTGSLSCYSDENPNCPKINNQNEFDLGCFKQLKH